MAIKITYADRSTEIVPEAVKVDYNYHEDTFDFCDESGMPHLQVRMAHGITWEYLEESESGEKE